MITKQFLQTNIHNLTVQRDSNMATIARLAEQRQNLIDETNSVHGSVIAYTNLLNELEAAEKETNLIDETPKLILPKASLPDVPKSAKPAKGDKKKK